MASRVLLMSSGSLVAAAVLDSLAGRRCELHVSGINSMTDVSSQARLDSCHRVPPTSSPDFADAMGAIAELLEPDLIVPTRDDDVVALARLVEVGGVDGSICSGGGLAVADSLRDKGSAARFAAQHALPFVPTIVCGESGSRARVAALLEASAGPWIVKPARGRGSRGVYVVSDRGWVLQRAMRRGLVVQPFLGECAGPHGVTPVTALDDRWSGDAQVVLGADGTVLATGCFLSRLRGGEVDQVRAVEDPGLLGVARSYGAVLSSLGWRGAVNIQARQDEDGQWLPFEVNPRFGGGTWARCLLGLDEVGLVLRSFLGSEALPLCEHRGARQVSRSGDHFTVED